MKNKAALLVAGAFFAMLSAGASARDNISFRLSIGVPGYVYDAPAPTYYYPPQVVYYPPPPVYYAPAPRVYYEPAPWQHRWHGHRHWDGHRHGHRHHR